MWHVDMLFNTEVCVMKRKQEDENNVHASENKGKETVNSRRIYQKKK